MPEGPFGFPRVTDIGPLTEVEAEQEFTREVENTFIVGTDVDREIATIHNVDIDDVYDAEAKLIVRTDQEESPDNVLDRLRSEFDSIFGKERIASMDYWYDPDTEVAKIFDVETREEFRRMGIATQLKEQELDYLKNQGIEVVYTDIISEGGYRLATRTGFKPIHEADHLRGTESMLTFNTDTNRGIMFKYL
jgi:GNAT superfamily N-acetyltransferase